MYVYKYTVLTFILFSAFSSTLQKFKQEVKRWPAFRTIHREKYIDALYKDTYDEAKSLINYQETPRIPKIIHQIWLGSPVPKQYSPLIKTWLKNHPDWEYKLWTDKDIEKMNLKNKDIYKIALNYGMKSDILRLEILYNYGGLYIDLDQECIQPHDIFHHITDFYVGLQLTKNPFFESVANGLIGASKNNELIKETIVAIAKNINFLRYSSLDKTNRTYFSTGPYQIANTIDRYCKKNKDNNNKFLLLPKPFFFPLECESCNIFKLPNRMNNAKKFIEPHCYGIQYHTCTWQKK